MRDVITRISRFEARTPPHRLEIPTCGCQLAIRGTGRQIGYLNIKDARIRDFLQPAIFPEDIEIWPPGSRFEIAWLHYKGDLTKEPTKAHPTDCDRDDMDNPDNLYKIDLVIGKGADLEFIRNVMPPTNAKVFWDSSGPFGKPDGVHEMFAWQFSKNKLCKYYFLGVMAFIWEVPEDLDPEWTYRLRFTINSHIDEEHISGPFRIRERGNEIPTESAGAVVGGWMVGAFVLVGVSILAILVARMLWRRRERQIML